MRHGFKLAKLNRKSSHRKVLLQSLAISLITHEQIVTTVAKAKALRPYVEKLITLGKKGDLHARRQAVAKIGADSAAVEKLFSTIAERYTDRKGGYTRIMRAGFRQGDSAPIAVIELVDRDISARGKEDRARHEAALAAQSDEEFAA